MLYKPDFQRSVVNISASLASYLGAPNDKPVLPELSEALEKGYKNVILLVLDGMGMHPLEQNAAAGGFFRRNIAGVLTSVFPSTTTNATTSLQTNTYPMEHGWFGWSLYFEELGRAVNIFEDVDSHTGEPIERDFCRRRLPTVPFYRKTAGEYEVNVVVPSFWREEENRYVWTNFEELFSHLDCICGKKGKQFVYAYCTQPDSVMHRFGVSSNEAKEVISALEKGAEAFARRKKDTLLIVTADHGQVDIDGSYDIYLDEELLSLLKYAPYLEARAVAFKVKEGRGEAFCALFLEKYGKDFALFHTEKLIRENYFGGGLVTDHAKLLGDYIAVGTTHKMMKLTPLGHPFKGHHTSLTEEMFVPLIVV